MTEKEGKKQVFQVNLEKQIEGSPVTKSSNRGWVNWGKKNNFPETILELYNNSPTLDASIQFCVSALLGNGIHIDGDMQTRPNNIYDWNEFIRRIATDYFLYGLFCVQVIKNKGGESYSFFHTPAEQVRCSERNSKGEIESYWLSADWSAQSKPENAPIEIPAFNFNDEAEYNLKLGQPYMYCYSTYAPTMNFYSLPPWWSAYKAVKAETEYLTYELSCSQNSFLASGCISMPPAADDEEKQAIVEEIRNTFIGSSNSSRLMVTFRNDSDNDQPVQFTKFSNESGEFDMFSSANERAINRILASLNIPNKQLIGMPQEVGNLTSEGALLETSLKVYQAIAGKYYRSVILGSVNNMFKMNGIDIELEVEDLKFGDDVSNTATETDNGMVETETEEDML